MSLKTPKPVQHTGLTMNNFTRPTLCENVLFKLHSVDMTLPVMCDLCHDMFQDWESFDAHTASHIESRLFPCQLCNCTYRSWENLVAHRKAYHKGYMLSCVDCSTQKYFPNLVPVNFVVGTSPHGCEECNLGFGKYDQLTRHYTTEHKATSGELMSSLYDSSLFACPGCKMVFHVAEELSVHMTSSQCYARKSVTKNSESLLNSKRTYKNLQSKPVLRDLCKKFICEYCAREFSNNHNFKVHIQRHLGERPYNCLLCTKKFYTKQQLTIHTHQHTGVHPYACKLCDKKFMSNNALYMHRRIHTAFKPYHCAQCGKKFFWQTAYIGHVRLHSGERPFACHLCKKTFAVKGKLNSHLKFHKQGNAEKYLYLCTDCKRIFATKLELINHQNDKCCVTVITPDTEEESKQNHSNGQTYLKLI